MSNHHANPHEGPRALAGNAHPETLDAMKERAS
jgi:hypothetical protein